MERGETAPVFQHGRIVDWALRNLADWEIVCGTGQGLLCDEEFQRLGKVLLDNDVEQAVYVLFYRYAKQNNIPVFPDARRKTGGL